MSAERSALVVDDDPGIRLLVTRIFQRHGFTVEAVRDGFEAIERLAGNDYCVIALDLMMPRVDGAAVVRYLTDHRPDQLRNVIVMTAFGEHALEVVCPPVTRFVEKPFDLDVLLAQVSECGDGPPASAGQPAATSR